MVLVDESHFRRPSHCTLTSQLGIHTMRIRATEYDISGHTEYVSWNHLNVTQTQTVGPGPIVRTITIWYKDIMPGITDPLPSNWFHI